MLVQVTIAQVEFAHASSNEAVPASPELLQETSIMLPSKDMLVYGSSVPPPNLVSAELHFQAHGLPTGARDTLAATEGSFQQVTKATDPPACNQTFP